MDAALNRRAEVTVVDYRERLLQARHCRIEFGFGFVMSFVGTCGYVHRHYYFAADCTLEFYGLDVCKVDVAVDGVLKRAGVGHDDAVEVENFMETFGQCTLPEILAFAEDIGVCYQRFHAEFCQLLRFDKLYVRVDDRQKERRSYGFVADLQLSESSHYVLVYDFKTDAHDLSRIFS